MPFSFACPHCGFASVVDEKFVGQSGPCAACGKEVTVESGPAPAASPHRRAASGMGRAIVVSLASIVGIVLLLGGVIGAVYLAVANSNVVGTGGDGGCAANLQAIGQAMLQYHNDNSRFPPAVVISADGRAMHSWRVLLLPYLRQEALFQQYNMSVPWDDPQNQLLSSQMPAVYHCAESFNVAGSETSYMVVTGAGGVFGGKQSASLTEILDGPAETLLVVETIGMAINWLEPRDLPRETLALTINGTNAAGIGSQHPAGGSHLLHADGSVKFYGSLTSPETLESLLTIDGADTPAE